MVPLQFYHLGLLWFWWPVSESEDVPGYTWYSCSVCLTVRPFHFYTRHRHAEYSFALLRNNFADPGPLGFEIVDDVFGFI